MPATHEDPAAPVITNPKEAPSTICPRQVTLRDRVTIATLVPFLSPSDVPRSLLSYLSDQLNKEIEKGDTYPMIDPIPLSQFGQYWFANFGAVMLLGDIKKASDVMDMEANEENWSKSCLGSFNIKPNYPGRSGHVCNGTFLVTDASRNRGVGRLMGEGYLEWAPKLGYTYSVFNLVYENNVASCRIWDALGFKRIGKIPACGNLKSYPDQLVDAIIYGRDLGLENEDSVKQERFDKIRYYLKHSKYPRGADRAEKSRLRSAATHYKLVGGGDGQPEKLMLKEKEVVPDLQQQYEIARDIHNQQHGGINKTTATIAVTYHWIRIKETVSRVIRDCPKCKESSKVPVVDAKKPDEPSTAKEDGLDSVTAKEDGLNSVTVPNGMVSPPEDHLMAEATQEDANPFTDEHPVNVQEPDEPMHVYENLPLDPQIIDINSDLPRYQHPHSISDPYGSQSHPLSHVNFEDELQHHAASNDYQSMVNDESDSDPLRRETLGLSSHSLSESQQDREMLARYVDRSEDELDFN